MSTKNAEIIVTVPKKGEVVSEMIGVILEGNEGCLFIPTTNKLEIAKGERGVLKKYIKTKYKKFSTETRMIYSGNGMKK